MRKAKIVSTIGPATEDLENMTKLVAAGMDVARLNRSHGTPEEHAKVYNNVRAAAKANNKNVAVLVDLQGPKIRLSKFENDEKHYLEDGQIVKIDINVELGSKQPDGSILVGTTYKGLPGDVKVGDPLLIDDGKVKLEAIAVDDTSITAKSVVSGPISNNKGINLPWAAMAVPALSEKDKEDLRWAVNIGADLIALSFVRSAKDYQDALAVMEEEGRVIPVIAKVEKPQAVEALQEIVDAFDGIMVARGDLAVEMPLEEVPLVQKKCIELCRRAGKPVIVATQVLETMTDNPTPTRAEASDCANAILDGADATMTSGETSVGKYPILTIETMAKISAYQTEYGYDRIPEIKDMSREDGGAIIAGAVYTAQKLGAKAIVTYTTSGKSAKLASRLRPQIPIIALAHEEHVRASLALSWGVEAYTIGKLVSADEIVHVAEETLLKNTDLKKGDTIVILSGQPICHKGGTNSVIVHKIGEATE
ncbi:MAG: pyruvate kinase [Candidatus Ancillula sp.]|jgi:pyruvate kinase|nr:pyruvate kinase [Candidatus Ancillula sp.]